MENTVPSGRGEFKPVETPLAAVEAGSPWIYSWEEVTKFRPKYNSSGGTLMEPAVIDNFFKGSYKMLELENHQDLTLEGVMGRYSSTSYAISPEEDEYESLRAEMKEAFGKYQNEGFVRIQYITKLFLGTV